MDVVVIGAGLAGLACGWDLRRGGKEVLVLERDTRPGGVVRTHEIGGFLVESGPNTILPTPSALELIREAGLDPEIVTAPPRLPRFVYVNGRLRKAPWVLSPRGMLRALAEPLVPSRRLAGDEPLSEFFTRRFGREVHDRLLAPFVSGIYAGNPKELGIQGTFPAMEALEREYGSVVVGYLRSRGRRSRSSLCSFRGGMSTLPERLAGGIDLRTGIADVRVTGDGSGGWRVHASGEAIEARSVVLALPAHGVGACLSDPVLESLLDEVVYAPILVAAAALGGGQLASVPRGFGFLVPRTEGLHVLGTLFSSTLFPGRSPEGRALLTTFMGGSLDPESPGWPDERVWTTLEAELRQVLGFGGPVAPVGLFRYKRGIPQYRTGHLDWRGRIGSRLEELKGLFLTGNYLDGVSVPATLEHGRQTAEAVGRYLEKGT